jgi:hypothetical protein
MGVEQVDPEEQEPERRKLVHMRYGIGRSYQVCPHLFLSLPSLSMHQKEVEEIKY